LPGEDHHVYELVSMYDLDTCMNRTAQSLAGVRGLSLHSPLRRLDL
jgi:hypothetical protein